MVEKTFCDICGEVTKDDKDLFDEFAEVFFDDFNNEQRKYDLCKKCQKEVNNFIKNKIKESEKKRNL